MECDNEEEAYYVANNDMDHMDCVCASCLESAGVTAGQHGGCNCAATGADECWCGSQEGQYDSQSQQGDCPCGGRDGWCSCRRANPAQDLMDKAHDLLASACNASLNLSMAVGACNGLHSRIEQLEGVIDALAEALSAEVEKTDPSVPDDITEMLNEVWDYLCRFCREYGNVTIDEAGHCVRAICGSCSYRIGRELRCDQCEMCPFVEPTGAVTYLCGCLSEPDCV